MPHIEQHIDPTDLIISITKKSNTELGCKLRQVYEDIFDKDELNFLIAAVNEIREIIATATPETTVEEVINTWANQRLEELD